jgi:hypothetical protein
MPQLVHTPETPQWFCCVPSWHWPFEQQNPFAQVPLPGPPQADVQKPDEQVGVRSTQALHMPPLFPHSRFAVPGTQVVPLQQPPLQLVWPAPQVVSQRCVAVLHDSPGAQCAAMLQVPTASGVASGGGASIMGASIAASIIGPSGAGASMAGASSGGASAGASLRESGRASHEHASSGDDTVSSPHPTHNDEKSQAPRHRQILQSRAQSVY